MSALQLLFFFCVNCTCLLPLYLFLPFPILKIVYSSLFVDQHILQFDCIFDIKFSFSISA